MALADLGVMSFSSWPISTRVKPENDDPSIIEPIELAIVPPSLAPAGACSGARRPRPSGWRTVPF